jgi:hypothetical protein
MEFLAPSVANVLVGQILLRQILVCRRHVRVADQQG